MKPSDRYEFGRVVIIDYYPSKKLRSGLSILFLSSRTWYQFQIMRSTYLKITISFYAKYFMFYTLCVYVFNILVEW